MNTRKSLVSVLMFVSVLLSACAPAVTATVIPPTADPSTEPAVSISPTSLSETPAIGKLLETIPLPVKPNRDAVYAFDSFWLIDDYTGAITRWDPASGQVLSTITVGNP